MLVILCLVYFLFVIDWLSLMSNSAIDCLERLVSEVTCYVSSGTLNTTHYSHSFTLLHTFLISFCANLQSRSRYVYF